MGNESRSEGSDFEELVPHISEKDISGSELDSKVQTHLPTWAKMTLSSAGQNIGNPADPRRTQSDFQREGISLSCHDSLMYESCYLIIQLYPNSYYHIWKYLIWKAAMDEEFNSLRKNATWELVYLPLGRKMVQCKWLYQT